MPPTQTTPAVPPPDTSPDDLILQHLPLAESLALRYRSRGETTEDLIQVAYLALVKAGRRYRPEQGSSFAAFAAPTIAGELRRHFRDHGWDVRPPRRLQELQAGLRAAESTLAQSLRREPTTGELARALEVAEADVRAARVASRSYTSSSLDDLDTGESEALRDGHDGFDEVLSSVTLKPLLDDLTPRDRRIIGLRYFQDATQAEIGREIGVTQMQVSRLLRQAVARMRTAAGLAAA